MSIRPDIYAVYAHLQLNSIDVKVGSQIVAGAPTGKRGNTGNSSSPQLHFGLLDSANIVSANSVPFVFAKSRMRAQIPGGDDKTIVITPDSRESRMPIRFSQALPTSMSKSARGDPGGGPKTSSPKANDAPREDS